MGRFRHLARLLAASAFGAALAWTPCAVTAQGAPGVGGGGMSAPRSGPGAREDRRSFGGQIGGRMNLIGPPTTETGPTSGLPATELPSNSMFTPERLDRIAPSVIDGIKMPKLDPRGPLRAPRPADMPAAPAPAPMEAALPSPALTAPVVKQPLALTATFGENDAKVPGGVKWRVFTDQPDANGEHLLVAESNDAAPRFELDPGNYIVHAVYGLVSAAKFVTISPTTPSAQKLVLNAGGLRLSGFVGEHTPPDRDISFTLSRDEGGVMHAVAEKVKPGVLLRLPAGSYHVVSNYGDANATVEVDLQVAAGKLTNAQVHHKAAPVTLRLVDRPGGPELGDTSWTILTPGGDVIRDSIGALPKIVLAEGDYTAIARHDGRMFQRNFAVKTGVEEAVEVEAR
ncbi:hypothetical protein [Hansschlegelia plantiphila]|uniref:Cupin type-1 domain-containing protein n=1 Tax=Hansschlegelia plantiphila TaxID=374655 RepID=A0A9W6J219_9HYPH|nr:hypothetical protein [Hansschlegelia plantiphila]GLK67943.1 hypothetical protein GCM10008179_15810 [Hansschlegelia plantiphila]